MNCIRTDRGTHRGGRVINYCHSELARNLWNPSGKKFEIPRKLGMTRIVTISPFVMLVRNFHDNK
jgi:hypothetical protein